VRKVPPALAMRLGHDGAPEFTELLEIEQQTWSERMLTAVTERFERRLIDETAKLRVELARDRFEVLNWMFVFWIGQLAAMSAIMSFLLRR
jgi:hypothetical protein